MAGFEGDGVMKILVLSLLRLGDVILHREIAQALKRQNPNCEIHFLINSQFESVQKLLPEVKEWHLVPRNEIQKILVEREQTPLKAFEKLQTLLADINSRDFDLILNATHNRFSVRLMDLFVAKEKRGVSFDKGRKTADRNRWQVYLNEHFSDPQGSRFHYLEVLKRSLELDSEAPKVAESRQSKLILLQLMTSDPKKNWGLANFRELKRKVEERFPADRVLGLCSPQESDQVSKVFAWNEFITPSLEEAAELLKQARLLITGDTSIQHLAAQQGCSILSLFLGSADPRKTAPWQEGAWVIQGQAACAPCSHSSPCFQSEHLCANSVSVQSVFELAEGILNQAPVRLTSSRTYQMKSRGFSFLPLNPFETLAHRLEQAVWSNYLNQNRAADLSDISIRESDISALLQMHNRFEVAVQGLRDERQSLSDVERSFPMWKDSLLRVKRDPTQEGSWAELQELIGLRRLILNQLSHQIPERTGDSHGRDNRKSSQGDFAEA